jgi:hypothetical protein
MLKSEANGMKRKGKEAEERRRIQMKAKSPYTLAYNVLLNAQSQNGARLHIRQVQEELESTPGIVFPPGTTVDEVLKNLESWELVQIEGKYVNVVAKH